MTEGACTDTVPHHRFMGSVVAGDVSGHGA